MTINSRRLLLVSFGLIILSFSLHAAEAPTKRVRPNEFFTIAPNAEGTDKKTGFWLIVDLETKSAKAENAQLLLAAYKQADAKEAKNGIFIYSLTHSMEWTAQERAKYETSLTGRLVNDNEWRAAENKLVDELVKLANAERVPVWVLLRGSSSGPNALGTYKLLTDPNLTLKN